MANVSKRYNKKWSELTDAEKAKSGSKAEHSAKRQAVDLKGTSAASAARENAQAHQTQAAAAKASQQYNDYAGGWADQKKQETEEKRGIPIDNAHTVTFGDDGKLNMDANKQQFLDTNKLSELGYSEGDNIYRGGESKQGENSVYGTGLMGAGGLEIKQAHINAHWQGGSQYNPQVERMVKSGQIKLDDNAGTWSSYDKQGNQLQSGNIDTSRERFGYTHESANAARDDKFYNSSSNADVKSQAQQFTQEQKVRDEETRQAEILRSQDPNGRPNFEGAWSDPRANQSYRQSGGDYEFNPSAYDNNPSNAKSSNNSPVYVQASRNANDYFSLFNKDNERSSALSDQIKQSTDNTRQQYNFDQRAAGSSQRALNLDYNFNPFKFTQGQ